MENKVVKQNEDKRSDYAASALLVKQATKGDKEALGQLIGSIAKGVLYRVKYGLNNESDAEDVAQEVLMRVCEKIHELRTPEAFRVWLGRIIMSETNNFRAKSKKQRDVLDISDYMELLAENRETFLPVHYAENADVRQAVLKAIERLPARQRQTVVLHYYDGLSVNDIAESLGLAQTSISTHLMRARAEIKAELERKSYATSPGSMQAMSIGVLLFDLFNEEAVSYAIPNIGWINDFLAAHCDGIAVGVTATAATLTAAATSTTAAAAGTTAVATGTTAAAATSSGSSLSIYIISLVAAAAITFGGLWYTGAFTSNGAAQAKSESAVHERIQPKPVQGEIAFAGGTINPIDANASAKNELGVLDLHHWWITSSGINDLHSKEGVDAENINGKDSLLFEMDAAVNSDELLGRWIASQGTEPLYCGDTNTLSQTLMNMHRNKEDGEYTLWFAMVDAEGCEYLLTRTFMISTPSP